MITLLLVAVSVASWCPTDSLRIPRGLFFALKPVKRESDSFKSWTTLTIAVIVTKTSSKYQSMSAQTLVGSMTGILQQYRRLSLMASEDQCLKGKWLEVEASLTLCAGIEAGQMTMTHGSLLEIQVGVGMGCCHTSERFIIRPTSSPRS